MTNQEYDLDTDDLDGPVIHTDSETGDTFVVNAGGYKVYVD